MDHRVLVVDDDPLFCGFVEMCLGELGFACYVAESPDEAVQKAIRYRPQCVVLDL